MTRKDLGLDAHVFGFSRDKSIARHDPNAPLALDEIAAVLTDELSVGENGTVLAVDTALRQAVLHGASDIYIEPWRDCVAVRYRLDGALHEIATIDKDHQDRIITRLKVLARLVIYHKETPQDGRIDANPDRLDRSFRVSSFPTIYGDKLVIRILDSDSELVGLDSLGFNDHVVSDLRDMISRPQGTLLLTGPSSSGKTTTIYACLREIMTRPDRSRHVVTIEDPVEYQLERVSQTQINPAQGLTYESAFRAVLRQDPDAIMIGEIRDRETARTVVQAGLSGHFVISTIHSGTAAGVFTRLLDMGVEPFLIASSMTGVLAQRLIRTNCAHCIETYEPTLAVRQGYLLLDDIEFKRGTGCELCRGIGYKGRTAIGELLVVNDEISELILSRATTRILQDAAVRKRMITLQEDGRTLVQEGKATLEELRMVVPPAER